jgi:hypothetical protein
MLEQPFIEERIDLSCMERMSNAVESLLLNADLNKGLESAFLSLMPLLPRDFPTKELADRIERIHEKHDSMMAKISAARDLSHISGPHFSYLRYSFFPGPTKHWFKREIWALFYGSIHHNGM